MQTLLGVVTFVVLLVAGLLGLQAGGSVPQGMIVLLSAAVGFGVWRAQENAKRAQELEAKLVTDKTFLYKVYIDVVREILDKPNAKPQELAPALKRLYAFAFGSVLIGSDDVVRAMARVMRADKVGDNMALPAMADVLMAMRRDSGVITTDLKPIDLLATFVKDVESIAPAFDVWAAKRGMAWPMSQGGPPDPRPSRQR